MRRYSKRKTMNKIAFTLLELVLVMAIMVLLCSYIFSTFYIINSSHADVAVLNDAKDYLALNNRAIQNILCNASAASVDGSSIADVGGTGSIERIFVDAVSGRIVYSSGSSGTQFLLENYEQYKLSDGSDKWSIELLFYANSGSQTVSYTIKLIDNATDTEYTQLQSSVYLPSADSSSVVSNGTGSGTLYFKKVVIA